MEKFGQYLENKGLLDLRGEALQLEREVYKRAYSRKYMQELRRSKKKIELFFSTEEFIQIAEKAKLFDLTKSSFCKEMIYASLGYEFPQVNAEEIAKLQLEIRQIGNLANQITRRVNTTRQIYPSDIRAFNDRLYDLEQLIALRLEQPHLFKTHVDQNSQSKNE